MQGSAQARSIFRAPQGGPQAEEAQSGTGAQLKKSSSLRPRFFLFGACPKRKNPPRPRQKKLAPCRFRGFRRSRESSISAPSFFLSKSDPLRWALIWFKGSLFLLLGARGSDAFLRHAVRGSLRLRLAPLCGQRTEAASTTLRAAASVGAAELDNRPDSTALAAAERGAGMGNNDLPGGDGAIKGRSPSLNAPSPFRGDLRTDLRLPNSTGGSGALPWGFLWNCVPPLPVAEEDGTQFPQPRHWRAVAKQAREWHCGKAEATTPFLWSQRNGVGKTVSLVSLVPSPPQCEHWGFLSRGGGTGAAFRTGNR